MQYIIIIRWRYPDQTPYPFTVTGCNTPIGRVPRMESFPSACFHVICLSFFRWWIFFKHSALHQWIFGSCFLATNPFSVLVADDIMVNYRWCSACWLLRMCCFGSMGYLTGAGSDYAAFMHYLGITSMDISYTYDRVSTKQDSTWVHLHIQKKNSF